MKILAILTALSVPWTVKATNNYDYTFLVGGEGIIRSRNFLREHGRVANSTWTFTSYDWSSFALILKINKLKLFHSAKEKICIGSYNLTIDGDLVKCTEIILNTWDVKTLVFYNSPTCLNVSRVSQNATKKRTQFPMVVKFESDGRKTDERGNIWGFEMEYTFISCPDRKTTPAPTPPETTVMDVTTRVTTEAEPTEELMTLEPSTSPKTERIAKMSLDVIRSREALRNTTKTKYNEESPSGAFDIELLTIILEAAAGIVGFCIVLVLAFGCKKRQKKRAERNRRISEAPLFDHLPVDFAPDPPTEAAHIYSINEASTNRQQSRRSRQSRASNQYASIGDGKWNGRVDYVAATDVGNYNSEENEIYASVTFNPNQNDQEITDYATMVGSPTREDCSFLEQQRYVTMPIPATAFTRSRDNNSLYVKMIVGREANNNEYEAASSVTVNNARNMATEL